MVTFPRPMTDEEFALFQDQIKVVRNCVSLLRLSRLGDQYEDAQVALTRLENWLAENDERWTVA